MRGNRNTNETQQSTRRTHNNSLGSKRTEGLRRYQAGRIREEKGKKKEGDFFSFTHATFLTSGSGPGRVLIDAEQKRKEKSMEVCSAPFYIAY